jgi:hypothetical protein
MTVVAPPHPPHDELEALIEEARRRARLRRLAYVATALFAFAAAGTTALIVAVTRNGGSA